MSDRTCRKCGAIIPRRFRDNEGRVCNLEHRKYCFQCSPFKQHNTRKLEFSEDSLEIMRAHKNEQGEIVKKCLCCEQEKFLTEFYFKSKDKKHLTAECKECFKKRCSESFKHKKTKVIYFGPFKGKCQICGYDKTAIALDFHHVIPEEKDRTITVYRNGFDKVKEEVKKCILLCANCHREFHAGLILQEQIEAIYQANLKAFDAL